MSRVVLLAQALQGESGIPEAAVQMPVPDLPLMGRYALAAVTQLAVLPPGARLRSAALADLTDVPRPILAKVLRLLARSGLVDGVKGHGGGYRLGRDADTIRIVDVLAALGEGGQTSRRGCALGVRECDPAAPCTLHAHWAAAVGPIERFLNETTLADVVGGSP